MTRFARAKGSKSSNERLPEEATSWKEMKNQLVEKTKEITDSKARKEFEAKRKENYKAFLDEQEESESKNIKWAEFPTQAWPDKKAAKGKNKKAKTQLENGNNGATNGNESDEGPEELSAKVEAPKVLVKKAKQKKKLLKIVVNKEEKAESNKQSEAPQITETIAKVAPKAEQKTENTKAPKPAKTPKPEKAPVEKKPTPKRVVDKESLTETDIRKIEKKKVKRLKQLEKQKAKKAALKELKASQGSEATIAPVDDTETDPTPPTQENDSTRAPKRKFEKKTTPNDNPNSKKAKTRDNQEHPRRKPEKPTKMTINGKEMDLAYFDGFPIKKEDAEHLKTLRKQMIAKGLPRSEINIALKLERRKAEKSLSREKKKVCFNCRKSGHNLSECPEVGNQELAQSSGTGICFKCGSTEHTHFQCRVVRGADYKFAQCFICNEQGHISKQCPDNARGLYPKGGACRVCGDVTHLKKDCPKFQAQQQKEEGNLDLGVYDGGNPDVLETSGASSFPQKPAKKQNKVIKF